MKYIIHFFCLLFLVVTEAQAEKIPYWIFFKDRGGINAKREIAKKIASNHPKNLSRRARIIAPDKLWNETDLPVNTDYVNEIKKITGSIRTETRFLNGVSAELEENEIARIRALPFVREVRPVAVAVKKPEPEPSPKPAAPSKTQDYIYGDSYNQLSMIRVPQMHNKGFLGDGIKIGVLDSGFDGSNTHTAFDSLRIGGMKDFVDGDGLPLGDNHGTEVLSIMAALKNGSMIGAAPHAEYYLARTEIVENDMELRIEEDNWVAGIEWADSMGVDIVNSSVGYTTFDDSTENHTYQDLDGETAITTIAADIAVSKGIVVVVSAGNEGDKLWRYVTVPADGKEVLAIGAVDMDQNIAPFSSFGPTYDGRIKPDFVAPGKGVFVVNVSGGYYQNSGTSYAAPLVAGSIALILEANPTWTPADVKEALQNTSRDLGAEDEDNIYGWGLIDALAAAGLEDSVDADDFRVYDPYPQPIVFSLSQRRIYFPLDVPAAGNKVILKIFTFNGDLVYRYERVFPESGSFRDPGYAVEWDGMNMSGEKTAPGVYFFSMEISGHKKHTGKIMVMR